jgi:hypothetical protein
LGVGPLRVGAPALFEVGPGDGLQSVLHRLLRRIHQTVDRLEPILDVGERGSALGVPVVDGRARGGEVGVQWHGVLGSLGYGRPKQLGHVLRPMHGLVGAAGHRPPSLHLELAPDVRMVVVANLPLHDFSQILVLIELISLLNHVFLIHFYKHANCAFISVTVRHRL